MNYYWLLAVINKYEYNFNISCFLRLGLSPLLTTIACLLLIIFLTAQVQLVASCVTIASVDRFGRRPLIMLSSAVCAVALTVGAVSFHLDSIPSWLPIVWTSIFKVGNACGISSLPATISAEIFPANVKSLAMTVLSLWVSALAAISLKIIPIFIGLWGVSSVLWCNVAVLLLILVFTYSCVPETKAKPFAEIQEELLDAASEGCCCLRGGKFELRTGTYFNR